MENKIKISDVVSIDISSLKDAKNCMDRLSELTKQYMNAEDINTLEQIKREFVSQLQFLAAIYSKFKKYKGPNHVYLEEYHIWCNLKSMGYG